MQIGTQNFSKVHFFEVLLSYILAILGFQITNDWNMGFQINSLLQFHLFLDKVIKNRLVKTPISQKIQFLRKKTPAILRKKTSILREIPPFCG